MEHVTYKHILWMPLFARTHLYIVEFKLHTTLNFKLCPFDFKLRATGIVLIRHTSFIMMNYKSFYLLKITIHLIPLITCDRIQLVSTFHYEVCNLCNTDLSDSRYLLVNFEHLGIIYEQNSWVCVYSYTHSSTSMGPHMPELNLLVRSEGMIPPL